jgi:hypothetical protein
MKSITLPILAAASATTTTATAIRVLRVARFISPYLGK